MQKCPICLLDFNSAFMICPKCGHDESANQKRYPTLVCKEKIEEPKDLNADEYYNELLKILKRKNEPIREKDSDLPDRALKVLGEENNKMQGMCSPGKFTNQASNVEKGNCEYNELLKILNARNGNKVLPRGNIVDQGECGEKISWGIYENGTLILSGTGKMRNYGTLFKNPPWKKWMKDIRRVEVGQGITSIGENSFCWAKKLEEVKLPNTLLEINDRAFWNCEGLKTIEIPESGQVIEKSVKWCCYNLQTVSLPNYGTIIGSRAFAWCKNLEKMELSYDLKIISEEMFFQCEKLKSVRIPFFAEKIETGAFEGCKSLHSIKISENTVIEENAFRGCPAKIHRFRKIQRDKR